MGIMLHKAIKKYGKLILLVALGVIIPVITLLAIAFFDQMVKLIVPEVYWKHVILTQPQSTLFLAIIILGVAVIASEMYIVLKIIDVISKEKFS